MRYYRQDKTQTPTPAAASPSQAYYKSPRVFRELPHKRYTTKSGASFDMTMTIKKAWKMWQDNSDLTAGFSTFNMYRPRTVRKLGTVKPDMSSKIFNFIYSSNNQ